MGVWSVTRRYSAHDGVPVEDQTSVGARTADDAVHDAVEHNLDAVPVEVEAVTYEVQLDEGVGVREQGGPRNRGMRALVDH